MAYTPRQQQILDQLSRKMNFSVDDITEVEYAADIPVGVTYRNSRGTFTRQTYDQLGSILTNSERDSLRQITLDRRTNQDTSFRASSALLNAVVNPRASDFSYSSGRITIPSAITGASRYFDPKAARLIAAGLGWAFGDTKLTNSSGQVVKFTDDVQEDRVRISDPSGIFINDGSGIMAPLSDTGCVLFPYTPSILINHTANYDTMNPTHSNYGYNFYQHSTTATIGITGTFTAKDPDSAAYVLAVQHFFRSVTKMFYGKDPEAGTPPPVLRLDGHGDYQFSSVPIVITEFSVELPTDVDYITANTAGPSTSSYGGYSGIPSSTTTNMNGEAMTKVPVVQQFSITCLPLYSRKSISNDFGLRDFAAGKLLGKKGGRGGFI